jgi:hypothetical protein
MRTLIHWLPAVFCLMLCCIVLGAQLFLGSDTWQPAFFCFLPMCFLFVGSATFQMHREIVELRAQVADMKQPERG